MSNPKSRWRANLFKILFTLFIAFSAFLIWLDARFIQQFAGQKWTLPASVYARPLELYTGLAISQAAIIKELQAAGYQNNQTGQTGTYWQKQNQLHIALRSFQFWDALQPAGGVLIDFDQQRISQIKSNLPNQLTVRLEPIRIGKIHTGQLEDRELISLKDTPQSLIFALLATEDRDFFNHHGVSIKGVSRALLSNIKHGRVTEGGSTLTQQLVKNYFLNDKRSYSRKIMEACLALVLELRFSKQEILEAYLNQVYVAQDGARAIHGFGLASQYLFNKALEDLELHETALLVGMMKGPSYYHPLRHPERALQRRNLVLELMLQQQFISAQQAQAAQQRPLNIQQINLSTASYPAYLDLVRRQLLNDYSEQQLNTEGLRIFTNMDPQWQWHSQQQLSHGIEKLQNKHQSMAKLEGAVTVIDHATGDVLALVGSRQPRVAGFNRALDAKRPIGSLIKPVVYLNALERGYHLATILQDTPASIKTAQGVWQPQNFDRQYHGDTLLINALAQSYNAASVNLGMQLGLKPIIKTLQRLGYEKNVAELPSVLLGSLDMSPLEVAQIYTPIAANGFYSPLNSIREVSDHTGKKLKRYPLKLEQRIQTDNAYLLDFALQNVMHEGTGKSVKSRFNPNAPIAGKTGTSGDQRDSWFAGYDNNRLAVVWLGNDDNLKLPLTGGTGALPIWADILLFNRSSATQRSTPANIHRVWIDQGTGLMSQERCQDAVLLPFIKGSEPKQFAPCTMQQRSLKNWFK